MFPQVRRGIFGWMRAGLIAGALFATLAIVDPAAAQTPVPCTAIGGGQYNCDWFRAGDGRTGGAIVAVGTTDGRLSAPGHELDHLPAEGR